MFIHTDDSGEVNDSTLCEALKAVVKGDIISYEIAEGKHTRSTLVEIQNSLTNLENSYMIASELLNRIVALKREYNNLLSKDVIKLLTHLIQKHFELGEKPHNLLARRIRQMHSSTAIFPIKTTSGRTLTNPKTINDRFMEFYSHVHKSQGNVDKEKHFCWISFASAF